MAKSKKRQNATIFALHFCASEDVYILVFHFIFPFFDFFKDHKIISGTFKVLLLQKDSTKSQTLCPNMNIT